MIRFLIIAAILAVAFFYARDALDASKVFLSQTFAWMFEVY